MLSIMIKKKYYIMYLPHHIEQRKQQENYGRMKFLWHSALSLVSTPLLFHVGNTRSFFRGLILTFHLSNVIQNKALRNFQHNKMFFNCYGNRWENKRT